MCVCCGGRRERYGEIRIMKEGEFQNCRPTHQSVCCEALWGSGAVQPNCNYLKEKRHGSRFIREHNIVLELLETMMLPQLSQINNWPCHTESVPHAVYTDTCIKVTLCKKIYFCNLSSPWISIAINLYTIAIHKESCTNAFVMIARFIIKNC